MTTCVDCQQFIEWLGRLAMTDEDAARLLKKLDRAMPARFCEQHAHYDRSLYRDFAGERRALRRGAG